MLTNLSLLERERGATAILVALSLLVLLGIVAFAVDLGAVFNEDRQDQTAADVGALAGALEYTSPADPDGVRDQVFSFVEQNVRQTYTAAQWESMWSACSDPAKPSGFNSVPAPAGWSVGTIDCISGSTDELRVKVPDQLVQATFGKVLGVDEIATRAVAHARVQFRQGGSVRPFGILAGVASGSTCLTTSPGGLAAPPCDGPDSGNFGTLNSQTWAKDPFKDNIVDCGVPGVDELALNIAIGVDHFIGLSPSFAGSGGAYGAFPSDITRLDDCQNVGGEAFPTDNTPMVGPVNTLRADTGFNLFQATKAGIISGTAADFPNSTVAVTPLLQQLSGSLSDRTLRERISSTQYQYQVDNTPLWMYLRDWVDLVGDGVPMGLQALCDRTLIASSADPSTTMSGCLVAYEAALPANPNMGPLFLDTLGANTRFGWVPQFHFTTWGSGNHWQPIMNYRMTYIDTIWFNCNGKFDPIKNDEPCNDPTKGLVFQPEGPADESTMQVGNGASMKELRLDQISAFLLPNQAVPHSVAAAFPGNVRGPFETVLTR